MTPRFTVQWTENGEPLIPDEWLAVPQLQDLASDYDKGYLKVLVLLNAYRSPYCNPARNLGYKERVKQMLADWQGRWGSGFKPDSQVLVSECYRQAESVFRKGIYDSLWEKLLILERKEEELLDALATTTFDSEQLDGQMQNVAEPEEEEDTASKRKKKTPKAEKPQKPNAMVLSEIRKSQSLSLSQLLKTQKEVTAEAELLRSQLWREVKPLRQARASDLMTKL